MKLVESILTKNPCYTAGRKITVKGLMLHSVGCSQPSAQVFVKNWNSASYDRACVHGFIDGNDGTIYQCLPWDHRGWHCGSGPKGSGNDTHISFEICEDNLADASYFGKVYNEAVELCAYLCKEYVSTRKYHLPQRGPCAGHCLQSRGCHALVPKAWEEHGHFPGGGKGKALRYFRRQWRRLRFRYFVPGTQKLG